jgi:hypothetical protein
VELEKLIVVFAEVVERCVGQWPMEPASDGQAVLILVVGSLVGVCL